MHGITLAVSVLSVLPSLMLSCFPMISFHLFVFNFMHRLVRLLLIFTFDIRAFIS